MNGRNPNEVMFNTSGCFDTGPSCGGWEHVVVKMNAELLEHVANIYYRALATGEKIHKLPSAAIDYFADMRKSGFK